MIKYQAIASNFFAIRVYKDGLITGFILEDDDGGYYYTTQDGIHRGKTFKTLDEVKNSLEKK